MAEISPYEGIRYYFEALRSPASPEEREGNLSIEKPRTRVLLTLLHEGPQTISQLIEKTELVVSEFQPVYSEMIQRNLISGPQWTDEVTLTTLGEQLAQLQEQV